MKFLIVITTLLFVMRMSFAFTVPAFLAPVDDVSEDSGSQAGDHNFCKGATCGLACCTFRCCDAKQSACC